MKPALSKYETINIYSKIQLLHAMIDHPYWDSLSRFDNRLMFEGR